MSKYISTIYFKALHQVRKGALIGDVCEKYKLNVNSFVEWFDRHESYHLINTQIKKEIKEKEYKEKYIDNKIKQYYEKEYYLPEKKHKEEFRNAYLKLSGLAIQQKMRVK